MAQMTPYDADAPTDAQFPVMDPVALNGEQVSNVGSPAAWLKIAGNPTNSKDAERLNKIMSDWSLAMNGDECRYLRLRCWSGDQGVRQRVTLCGFADLESATCGMATAYGQGAAKAAYQHVLVSRQGLPWGTPVPTTSTGGIPYVPPASYPGTSPGGLPGPVFTDPDRGIQTPTIDLGIPTGPSTGTPTTTTPPVTTTAPVVTPPTPDAAAPLFTQAEAMEWLPWVIGGAILLYALKGRK